MPHRRLPEVLLPALLVLAVGCGSGAAAAERSFPEAVRCKLFWRASSTVAPGESPMDPKFQFQERLLRTGRGEKGSVGLADVTLDVHYLSDPYEGSAVSIKAAFEGRPAVS